MKSTNRLKEWLIKNKVLAMIVAGSLVLAGSGVAVYLLVIREPVQPDYPIAQDDDPDYEPEPPEPIIWRANLTGRIVETEAEQNAAVTAIMIENSMQARPQSGLKEAGLVFESEAEGGITRFFAFYQSEKPEIIGPVRSLRTYNIDWAAGFQATLVYYGGSAASLQLAGSGAFRTFGGNFLPASAHWRAADRWAPHNVYTSFERLDALNRERGFLTSDFVGFARKDDEPAEAPNATNVRLNVSHMAAFSSRFRWDPETNRYFRYQGADPHIDREHGHIAPNVVVGMIVDQRLVYEDGWRNQIHTVGSGRAYFFQDGTVTVGRWRQTARDVALEFLDEEGNAFALNRGQTWIVAVPSGRGSVSWE